MKKIRKAVLSLILAATMTVSAVPVICNAEQLPPTGTYIDENNVKYSSNIAEIASIM